MFTELIELALENLLYFALHLESGGVFPKPLSAAEEEECFRKMHEGDRGAKNKLIEHNLRLVAHIIKKYYNVTTDQEDLISIGTIGLIKAVSTFDYSKKTRFATYASRCIENAIITYRNAKLPNMFLRRDVYICFQALFHKHIKLFGHFADILYHFAESFYVLAVLPYRFRNRGHGYIVSFNIFAYARKPVRDLVSAFCNA